jgi:hypothetical protein
VTDGADVDVRLRTIEFFLRHPNLAPLELPTSNSQLPKRLEVGNLGIGS